MNFSIISLNTLDSNDIYCIGIPQQIVNTMKKGMTDLVPQNITHYYR